jgi:acyl carrier protein
MDADGQLVSSDVMGEVVVRGATVFIGYENDPVANERAFHEGWYRTGDCGFMDAEGYLKLLGRLDEVINRGGEKISPREIDEALLEHEAVVHAVCFSVPHPTLHHEVAAAVMLRSGADVTEDELRKFLALRLTPFKIPRRIIFTGELPKGPTGKFARTRLAEHFGLTGGESARVIAEAHTTIQQILLTFWREVLRRDDIGVDDDFFLLGGDSVTALDLLLRIEKGLQYRLPLTVLAEAPTIRSLEGRLERSTLGAIGNTIRVNGDGARHPLFAICGRFGHALRLLPVLRALGPDQPGYALQPPDMDWTSVGCVTLSHMAAHYIGQVKAAQPRGPYRLLGTSFGGLVAFEMALQLQSEGETVEFLGLVDANPPTCLIEGVADVSHSSDDPPVAKPNNWVEDINNSVAEAHLRARRLYVLDAGSQANRFRGELTYFYCTGNPIVANDRRRLWQRFADRLKLLPLSGVHGTYNLDPQFTDLTALLRDCLSGAPAPVCDPASVFDRTYRIDSRDTHQIIVSSTGEVFSIDQDVVLGHVEALDADPKRYRIVGWAVDPCKQSQPQTIAVFVNDKFLGYGACGVLRTDVAKRLTSTSARYVGFNFLFEREAAGGEADLPRLFALSPDGHAVELRSAEPRG